MNARCRLEKIQLLARLALKTKISLNKHDYKRKHL